MTFALRPSSLHPRPHRPSSPPPRLPRITSILLAFLALVPGTVPAADAPAPLPTLTADAPELATAFDDAKGRVRILLVTSADDRRARNLARAFRARVLPELKDVDLQVIAVWIAEDGKRTEEKALEEAGTLADPRLAPFRTADAAPLEAWRTAVAAASALEGDDLPESGWIAVYPPAATLEEGPPAPAFWTHADKKLARKHPGFDPDALRTAITELGEKDPEDVAGLPTVVRRAGGNAEMPYYLHGPRSGSKAPEEGRALVVILPGGGGDRAFRPFVKRLALNGCPPDAIVAQPISRMWTPDQKIIWPTEKTAVAGQKFSTETYIDRVIEDAVAQHTIDRDRIVLLGWSSSGPALYAHALRKKAGSIPVTRYFISQSVFQPERLPSLEAARGKRFHLHHSRTDRRCPFADAERALASLREVGATVDLVEYEGGHGWHGDVYGKVREGIDALCSD